MLRNMKVKIRIHMTKRGPAQATFVPQEYNIIRMSTWWSKKLTKSWGQQTDNIEKTNISIKYATSVEVIQELYIEGAHSYSSAKLCWSHLINSPLYHTKEYEETKRTQWSQERWT